MKLVKEAGLISRFRGQDILDRQKLEYYLRNVDNYMLSKGFYKRGTANRALKASVAGALASRS